MKKRKRSTCFFEADYAQFLLNYATTSPNASSLPTAVALFNSIGRRISFKLVVQCLVATSALCTLIHRDIVKLLRGRRF
jgi:hypothetical protein